MKRRSRWLLLVTLILVLMSSACAPSGGIQTAGAPTSSPSVETPTATPTGSETPTSTPTESETPAATSTGEPGAIPLDPLCTFCVEQVSLAIVAIPEEATFTLTASASEMECDSVEKLENNKQLVLCHGAKLSSLTSFELEVCQGEGNCTKHQVSLPDCSGTATPVMTEMATATTAATSAGAKPSETPMPATSTSEVATITPTPT